MFRKQLDSGVLGPKRENQTRHPHLEIIQMQQVVNTIKKEFLLLTEILKTNMYLDHKQKKGRPMKHEKEGMSKHIKEVGMSGILEVKGKEL